MGRKPRGIGRKEEVRLALLTSQGEFITVDEIISLIGLNGPSSQENRRRVVRTQIQRLRGDGLEIETQGKPNHPNSSNTAYRLVSDDRP